MPRSDYPTRMCIVHMFMEANFFPEKVFCLALQNHGQSFRYSYSDRFLGEVTLTKLCFLNENECSMREVTLTNERGSNTD